jgi:hypothetical protein
MMFCNGRTPAGHEREAELTTQEPRKKFTLLCERTRYMEVGLETFGSKSNQEWVSPRRIPTIRGEVQASGIDEKVCTVLRERAYHHSSGLLPFPAARMSTGVTDENNGIKPGRICPPGFLVMFLSKFITSFFAFPLSLTAFSFQTSHRRRQLRHLRCSWLYNSSARLKQDQRCLCLVCPFDSIHC